MPIYRNIIVILLTLLACCPTNVKAQIYDELMVDMVDSIDITERLPPLSKLQALAVENSPILRMADAEIEEYKYRTIEARREWMRYVGFEAGAKYGLFDNLIVTEDMGITESNTNTTEQLRYNVGVFIKVPIVTLFDKSNVKAAKAEKIYMLHQRELRIQEIRQLTITQYYKVISKYREFLILTNTVESFRVQCMRGEEDFNNGNITTESYSEMQNDLSKTAVSLEETKSAFISAYKILEDIVGVKLNLKH